MASSSQLPSVVQLKPFLQPFPYGREGMDSWAAQYALATPSLKAGVERDGGIKKSQPYGEIWLGSTHQNGPCEVEGKEGESLKDLIQKDPRFYLGEKLLNDQQMASQYPNDLPYLFKVLSFDKPLPLQCHPDKTLGGKLMDEEKRKLGKNSDFVDSNAKPEVGVALSPFTAFVGFRPPEQLAATLRGTPELQQMFKDSTLESFYQVASSSPSDDQAKAALRSLFHEAINLPKSKVKSIVQALQARFKKDSADVVFAAANEFTPQGEANASGETEATAMKRVFEIGLKTYGEEDVGVLASLALMNILRLRAGEGTWILADDLHAYVEGDIIECMANSDNMVAHGLGASEQGGISTFVEMLSYRHLPAEKLLVSNDDVWSKSENGYARLYNVPIAEFDLLAIFLSTGRNFERLSPLDGPLCFVVTQGEVTVSAGDDSVTLTKGQAGFVSAGTEVKFTREGEAPTQVWGAFYQ
ncbi:Mannose-6-phosphate isomerase [Rhodotorula toruloides]